MALYDDLIAALPELSSDDFGSRGFIELRNDSDGKGDYIAKWEYSQPLPNGMKVGK